MRREPAIEECRRREDRCSCPLVTYGTGFGGGKNGYGGYRTLSLPVAVPPYWTVWMEACRTEAAGAPENGRDGDEVPGTGTKGGTRGTHALPSWPMSCMAQFHRVSAGLHYCAHEGWLHLRSIFNKPPIPRMTAIRSGRTSAVACETPRGTALQGRAVVATGFYAGTR